jgi:hypothetical protein
MAKSVTVPKRETLDTTVEDMYFIVNLTFDELIIGIASAINDGLDGPHRWRVFESELQSQAVRPPQLLQLEWPQGLETDAAPQAKRLSIHKPGCRAAACTSPDLSSRQAFGHAGPSTC